MRAFIKKYFSRFDFNDMFTLEMYEKLVAWGKLGLTGKHLMIRIPIPHIARTQDPYSYDTFEAVCDWVFQVVWSSIFNIEWRVINFIREGSEVRNRQPLGCLSIGEESI